MRNWYRAMVAFLTISAMFCTSAVVYVGFQLWHLGESRRMTVQGDRIEWSCGVYEGTGVLRDGLLQEMRIRRVRPELQDGCSCE